MEPRILFWLHLFLLRPASWPALLFLLIKLTRNFSLHCVLSGVVTRTHKETLSDAISVLLQAKAFMRRLFTFCLGSTVRNLTESEPKTPNTSYGSGHLRPRLTLKPLSLTSAGSSSIPVVSENMKYRILVTFSQPIRNLRRPPCLRLRLRILLIFRRDLPASSLARGQLPTVVFPRKTALNLLPVPVHLLGMKKRQQKARGLKYQLVKVPYRPSARLKLAQNLRWEWAVVVLDLRLHIGRIRLPWFPMAEETIRWDRRRWVSLATCSKSRPELMLRRTGPSPLRAQSRLSSMRKGRPCSHHHCYPRLLS